MGGGYLNNKKITPKKSLVIGVLVGGIVFGSIGVAAATYFSASQVSYSPSDTSWNVSDVKGALDDLYINVNSNSNTIYKYTFDSFLLYSFDFVRILQQLFLYHLLFDDL